MLFIINILIFFGNCIIAGDNQRIAFKRLDMISTHSDNIVYSYNQAVNFIKTYPCFPNIPINQQNINHFLEGPVKNFLDKNNLTQMNINRFIRQNCMVNSIHFSNVLNKNYLDGDTALFVTINSKNFLNMSQVIEECAKHNIDIKNIVVLDISNNCIEQITAEDLGQFANLQALVAHNNKITSIDITKNPYLSMLACQKNKLTQGLHLMQKIKKSITPSFINLVDNSFDENESRRILNFINVSEEALKDDEEMISFYGSKEINQPIVFLPIMAYNKDKKYKLDFSKSAHIQTAEDRSLIELLVHNKSMFKNHIINKAVKVTAFRNLFKKYYHNQYNYLRDLSSKIENLPVEKINNLKNTKWWNLRIFFLPKPSLIKSIGVLILVAGLLAYMNEKINTFIFAKVRDFLKG